MNAWTPELIQALFSGIERLLIAIGVLATTIVGIWFQVRASRKAGEKVGEARDAKLTEIHSTATTVVGQLNGERTALLSKIATLERLIADESGRRADATRASASEQHAAAQQGASEAVKPVLEQARAKAGDPT